MRSVRAAVWYLPLRHAQVTLGFANDPYRASAADRLHAVLDFTIRGTPTTEPKSEDRQL